MHKFGTRVNKDIVTLVKTGRFNISVSFHNMYFGCIISFYVPVINLAFKLTALLKSSGAAL